MKITLARAMGTCFGVRDAIEAAMDDSFRNNLTIIGELVHNPQTVDELQENGVKIISSLDEPIPTRNVMITAHGAPESLKAKLEAKGHTVYDASCPLVLKVHNRVAALVEEGYFPVVIGQRNHVEVRGIVGDLEEYDVILHEEDLDRLAGRDKLGIVCQTTHQIEAAQALVDSIRDRYPGTDVRFVDTICKPTKDRQKAVHELADETDLMIVVGGFNSSNTKKLRQVCLQKGVESHHIERPEDLLEEWFVGREHVGITAGTSTPHKVIEAVYDRIQQIASGIAGRTSAGAAGAAAPSGS